jgi:hypothetical protein
MTYRVNDGGLPYPKAIPGEMQIEAKKGAMIKTITP